MTDTNAERVWFRFMRVHTRGLTAIGERLRAIGLSVPQCDVLTTLTEREGIAQQELAERLYVTKGNISGLIDRLTKAGLVERRPSREDKRSHAIFLTDEGRRLALLGIQIQKDYISQIFGDFEPAMLGDLENALMAIRDGIREARLPDEIGEDGHREVPIINADAHELFND